jgi:hypothetical protein
MPEIQETCIKVPADLRDEVAIIKYKETGFSIKVLVELLLSHGIAAYKKDPTILTTQKAKRLAKLKGD